MKPNTKTNKTPALFNEDIELIDCITSPANLVHKKNATPIANNSIFSQNRKYFRSVDNVLIHECSFFDVVSDRTFFIHDKSLSKAFAFIRHSYKVSQQYYKDYENFSIFKLVA